MNFEYMYHVKKMKIALFGACGKMGQAVAALAGEKIVCGVDLIPRPMPFPVYQTAEEICEEANVAIDFSSPKGLEERLNFCEERNLPLVLAVTGLSEADEDSVRKSAQKIPIVEASNLSVGVYVLNQITKVAAQLLEGFDVEIVETHHRGKKDAPSGTALRLAKSVKEGLGLDAPLAFGRTAARKEGEIGIHSLRGGSVFGVHEVHFLGGDERLLFSHTAESRSAFAKGALCAARFLLNCSAGLYDADDVYEPCLIERLLINGSTFEEI